MAKKTRRPNLSQETLERARREMAQSGMVIEEPVKTAAGAAPDAPKTKRVVVPVTVDLSTQYAYVINDLRNMAVLAACMMIVLVALSLSGLI